MKKVFSNSSQTIHVFAQQTQSEGRCGNVFFEDNIIYSYGKHFALAKFINQNTILINNYRYSVTTSKHQSEIRQATRQYNQIFLPSDQFFSDSVIILNSYAKDFLNREFENATQSAAKRKKAELAQADINAALYHYDNIKKVIELRGGKIDKTLSSQAKKLEKLFNDPATIEKIKAQEKAKQAKIEKALQEKIAKWLNGEQVSISQSKTIYMRLKNENTIQTSYGAEFPLDQGIEFFNLIKKIKQANKTIEFNQYDKNTPSLGYYKVNRVTNKGDVKAGCHFVKYPQIEYIAKQLNLA